MGYSMVSLRRNYFHPLFFPIRRLKSQGHLQDFRILVGVRLLELGPHCWMVVIHSSFIGNLYIKVLTGCQLPDSSYNIAWCSFVCISSWVVFHKGVSSASVGTMFSGRITRLVLSEYLEAQRGVMCDWLFMVMKNHVTQGSVYQQQWGFRFTYWLHLN